MKKIVGVKIMVEKCRCFSLSYFENRKGIGL